MTTLNKGALKYLFMNSALNNGQLGSIIGCSSVTVGKYRQTYENGKMLGVTPDSSIAPALETFLSTLSVASRARHEERVKHKASPVVTITGGELVEWSGVPKPQQWTRPEHDYRDPATSEDDLLTQRAETPTEQRKAAITLTLDRVEDTTIEQFLAVIRGQMEQGKSYRLHINLEAV